MKKKYYILIAIFATIMILSIISLTLWYFDNQSIKEIVSKEKTHLQEEEEETYTLDKRILEDNPNTVGWLIVSGTNIDYPVLQYSDNSYYLNHDFNNQYNNTGWIFMDYRNHLDDQNIVIYGHHRRDGSMFGSTDLLFNKDFYKENQEILLITPEETITYVIFSVYSTNSKDNYTNQNFDNFRETLELFKNRSKIDFDVSLDGIKQIITLSTCNNNNVDRDVIHAYKKKNIKKNKIFLFSCFFLLYNSYV